MNFWGGGRYNSAHNTQKGGVRGSPEILYNASTRNLWNRSAPCARPDPSFLQCCSGTNEPQLWGCNDIFVAKTRTWALIFEVCLQFHGLESSQAQALQVYHIWKSKKLVFIFRDFGAHRLDHLCFSFLSVSHMFYYISPGKTEKCMKTSVFRSVVSLESNLLSIII